MVARAVLVTLVFQTALPQVELVLTLILHGLLQQVQALVVITLGVAAAVLELLLHQGRMWAD